MPTDMKVIPLHLPRSMVRRSTMAAVLATPETMKSWQKPPFQRMLTVNKKVVKISEELKENGGIVSGVITIGRLPGDETRYLMDGQHRREACLMSNMPEFYVDIREVHFETMADMADEYINLQMPIVRMKTDDVLRAMEMHLPPLKALRERCNFLGYEFIRTRAASPKLLSVSSFLRCWRGSDYERPSLSTTPIIDLANSFTDEDMEQGAEFLLTAYEAWGDDFSNFKLWNSANLIMCMWLWRLIVIDQRRDKVKKYTAITRDQFRRCLMSLSSDHIYTDWLVGKSSIENNRGAYYTRINKIFANRLKEDCVENTRLPHPLWSAGDR